MRAEAHEEADAELAKYAARANGIAGITPERAVREGDKAEEILRLIDEDEDIFILVLAADTGSEGPGPLVADHRPDRRRLSHSGRHRPGHLSDEEIDALSEPSAFPGGKLLQRGSPNANRHLNFQ